MMNGRQDNAEEELRDADKPTKRVFRIECNEKPM